MKERKRSNQQEEKGLLISRGMSTERKPGSDSGWLFYLIWAQTKQAGLQLGEPQQRLGAEQWQPSPHTSTDRLRQSKQLVFELKQNRQPSLQHNEFVWKSNYTCKKLTTPRLKNLSALPLLVKTLLDAPLFEPNTDWMYSILLLNILYMSLYTWI